MDTNDTYEDVVNRLFEPTWLCLISKECLSLIHNDIPVHIDVSTYPTASWGSLDISTGVIRTEVVGNEQGIIEMLYGRNRVTADMEVNVTGTLLNPEHSYLSTAEIAELMAASATLILENPKDSVAMHTDIATYLEMLKQKKLYEPHFIEPPKADIEAFMQLYKMLDEMAIGYVKEGLGDSPLAQLLSLMSSTTSGVIPEAEAPKLTLNGQHQSANLHVGYKATQNPYKWGQ